MPQLSQETLKNQLTAKATVNFSRSAEKALQFQKFPLRELKKQYEYEALRQPVRREKLLLESKHGENISDFSNFVVQEQQKIRTLTTIHHAEPLMQHYLRLNKQFPRRTTFAESELPDYYGE